MKIATIISHNNEKISLYTGKNGVGDRVLMASNCDDIHPHSRPYRRGACGTWQAIMDVEMMWGRDTSLEWADFVDCFPKPDNFTTGYIE